MSTNKIETCGYVVLVEVTNPDGSYRLVDVACVRDVGHIGLHVVPEIVRP